ncbi:MAG: hypothetical protein NXH85_04870 [Pseudomonadaceae bacterium]|nr:hypothetical protein [Pseudomonadaceae bacterium]
MADIQFSLHKDLAVVRIEGDFSLQDLTRGIQDMYADPHFSASTRDLWDFTSAQWHRVREDMHGMADSFREWLNSQPRTSKTAMLFGSEAEKTLLQLFYESGEWDGNWRFFTDEHEARHWLSQP